MSRPAPLCFDAAIIVLLEDSLASSGFDGIGIITRGIFIIVVLLFRKGVWGTAMSLFDREAIASRRAAVEHERAGHGASRSTG